jgi:hypothetical protein
MTHNLVNDLEAGLYQDDGLAILRHKSACQANRIVKTITAEFKKDRLKITIDNSLNITNFLDITLNLHHGSYRPTIKPNNTTQYVNRNSNHPESIIKMIPTSINQRQSNNASNENQFKATTLPYHQALKYNHTLKFDYDHIHNHTTKNICKRKR